MDLDLVTAGDVPRGNWKVLVYGPTGSGKTWAASQCEGVVVVECEANGVDTVLRANPKAQLVRASGRPYLTTILELGTVVKAAADGKFTAAPGKRRVLVIDSLTEVQRLIKDDILHGRVQARQEGRELKRRGGRERGAGGRAEDERDEELFTLPDWEELTERMRRLLRTIRDLPLDVVCTALDEELYDDKGALLKVRPGFQGKKLQAEVGQFFNAIGYVQKRLRPGANPGEVLVDRSVLFSAPPKFSTKECGALDGMVVPDGAEWFRLLRGEDQAPADDGAVQDKPKRSRKAAEKQEVASGNA